MRSYLITDTLTGQFSIVPLEEAARITQLREEGIEWAITEFGVGETDRHVIRAVTMPDVFELSRITCKLGAEA